METAALGTHLCVKRREKASRGAEEVECRVVVSLRVHDGTAKKYIYIYTIVAKMGHLMEYGRSPPLEFFQLIGI